MTRFTLRELRALEEALNARLAGEIGTPGEPQRAPRREHYQAALDKVQRRIVSLLERKSQTDPTNGQPNSSSASRRGTTSR